MNGIILVDMDHTLSDSRSRDRFLKSVMTPADWDNYHRDMINDPVFTPIRDLIVSIRKTGYQVFIVTSRPEKYRSMTEAWLGRHGCSVDAIFMRPDDDATTPSARLKAIQVLRLLPVSQLALVRLIIDDRDDVIESFAKLGICGLKVCMS